MAPREIYRAPGDPGDDAGVEVIPAEEGPLPTDSAETHILMSPTGDVECRVKLTGRSTSIGFAVGTLGVVTPIATLVAGSMTGFPAWLICSLALVEFTLASALAFGLLRKHTQ